DILGPLDILLGSAATLVAALLTRRLRFVRWRGLPVLAVLPPIILNALVVGGELSYMMTGGFSPAVFWLNAAQVGAGELIACVTLGLPLVWALERNQRAILLFEE
ncbi:MAG: QueT transporter family protein, partial [Oscillospiraceae bacterium]